MVSAGNFLTIAMGANYLSVFDQGKLVYLYTIYIALVLLNTAVFFSSANILRQEFRADLQYQYELTKYQSASALLTVTCLLIAGVLMQKGIGLDLSLKEWILVCIFLFLQQITDFYRRSGYVFEKIQQSAISSAVAYGLRISGIALFQPSDLTEFLFIIIIASSPIALLMMKNFLSAKKHTINAILSSDQLRKTHLRISKWTIFNAPLKWIGLHLPIILAGSLHSIEAAAIIGSVRSITTFANVLLEQLETFIPAWLASSATHSHKLLKKRSIYLLIAGAIIWVSGLILIGLLGEITLLYLLGPTYAKHSNLLYVIWFANGLYFAGRVISLHYRSMKNSKLEFYGSLAGTLALTFTIPTISKYGADGAAWSLVIVQAVSLLGLIGYRHQLVSQRASYEH